MSIITTLLAKKETKEYFLLLALEAHRIRAAICQILGNQVSIKGTGESEFFAGENESEAVDIAISMAEKKLTPEILIEKVIFALPQTFLAEDNIKPEYLEKLKTITSELSLKAYGFIEYPTALSFHLEKEEGAPPTLLLLQVTKQQLIFSLLRVGKIQQNIITPRAASLASDFETNLSQFTSEILPSRIIIYDEGGDQQLEELKEELLRFPWNRYSIFLHTPKIEILSDEKVILALVDAAASSFLKTISLENIAPQSEIKATPETNQTGAETFGFVKTEEAIPRQPKVEKSAPPIPPDETDFLPKQTLLKLPKLSFSLPHFSLLILPKIIFMLSAVFLPVIFLTALFWLYPKATVSLIVYPQTASQKIDLTLVTSENKLDPAKNMILVTSTTEEVTGSKTIPVTGKTKIGEKAKGEVTIYNKTTSSKTFPKSTVLLTDDLKFTLDNEATIASASETGEGMTFGKTAVNVTAGEIGPESNISGSRNFTFKDFPATSYTAKSNKDFTGGTSREVSSVSTDDQNKLETSLANELITQVKQQSFTKLPPGEKLISSLITSTVSAKKFSSNVGSEAKELTLTLTVKISGFSYKETDLAAFSQKSLPPSPAGFILDTQRTNILIDDAKIDKNGNMTASVLATAYFLPELEKEKIKINLSGKTYQQATSILSSIQYIGGVKIIKEADLPFWGNRLPLSSKNITLQLVTY